MSDISTDFGRGAVEAEDAPESPDEGGGDADARSGREIVDPGHLLEDTAVAVAVAVADTFLVKLGPISPPLYSDDAAESLLARDIGVLRPFPFTPASMPLEGLFFNDDVFHDEEEGSGSAVLPADSIQTIAALRDDKIKEVMQ